MRTKNITIKEYPKEKNIDTMATKASNMGIYTVDSLISTVHYFFEDDEVVIATPNGHLRTTIDRAETLAKELTDLIPEIRNGRREGRTVMDSRSIGKMLESDFV